MNALEPAPPEAQLASIRKDGSRVPIHPADVRGRFITWRRVVFAVLMAVYALAPVVSIGSHPAVFLDIAQRRFYLFGATFNSQDVWLVLLLALALVFTLLLVTAWRGRIFCGWACPQTVFLEGLFRPIERFWDGPHTQRLKQHLQPWTAKRVGRLVGKHASYGVAAALVAHIAVSLFVSLQDLQLMMLGNPSEHPIAFGWAVGMTALMYFNFAWFREQFCVVLCPYGRLQSALHDDASIVVSYDFRRGEPRGPLARNASVALAPKGDCIDCRRCVVVCPTAIDIRHGLQMECVACAQCVDACDEVMVKIGKPKGLIRYASHAELHGKPTRVLRPRLAVYAVLALVATGALTMGLASNTGFEANVVRPPGMPYVLEGTRVKNILLVHLVNKGKAASRFHIAATVPDGIAATVGTPDLTLEPFEMRQVPVALSFERTTRKAGDLLVIDVSSDMDGATTQKRLPILGP